MNLSFHEKSLWLMLVCLIAAFTYYFAHLWQFESGLGSDLAPENIRLFIVTSILLLVLHIAGAILIAVLDKRPRTDERDRQIELKGSHYEAIILSAGIFLALCTAVLVKGNYAFCNLLLGFWVLAQLVGISTQLFLHRRGA